MPTVTILLPVRLIMIKSNYSISSTVNGVEVSMKGCSPVPSRPGCKEEPVPGFGSGQVCFCTASLCNSVTTPSVDLSNSAIIRSVLQGNTAITASVGLPLLVLPAVLRYFM